MKLNEKVVKSITINEEKRTVTVVTDDLEKAARKGMALFIEKSFGVKDVAVDLEPKTVTMSRCNPKDEFDKYTGVALALAYNMFGSRTQFIKYVDSLKVVKKKENVKNAINELKTLPTPKQCLYGNYTLQQLRDMAKERGLKGYSKLSKSELVDLIFNNVII